MSFKKWLQSRLTSHGFACGGIDGEIGPVTLYALRSFQKANNLPVTGQADKATVEALRRTSSSVAFEEKGFIPDRDKQEPDDGRKGYWPRQKDVAAFYGDVGTRQTQIEVPWTMRLAWDKNVRIRKMTLHEEVAPSAVRVFEKLRGMYSDREIKALGLDLFGGSLNVRRMRGGSRYSMHSWGIAIDFDPERNRLSWKRPQARLSLDDVIPYWQAWEAEGWLSLGRVRNFDWMHVQAARL
ncbi:peptidoglycan-binding protein [Roseibium alexandrii]|uniref:Spore cortex-lytic enzyme n=2 Tax=Stappiaceae TaxID=2821832 RepID=A0A0M7ALC7_9HYPH|nr:peptidoglycan-binding protein [Roseibium alexandrii]CTQ75925.1 spore cortex-lytic enzyme [Roseibium alexandrii]